MPSQNVPGGTLLFPVNAAPGFWYGTSVAFGPNGAQLYAAGNAERAIAVFDCDPATGLLTFVEVEKDGVNGVNGLFGVNDLVVAPDGAHVYAVGTVEAAKMVMEASGDGSRHAQARWTTVLQE